MVAMAAVEMAAADWAVVVRDEAAVATVVVMSAAVVKVRVASVVVGRVVEVADPVQETEAAGMAEGRVGVETAEEERAAGKAAAAMATAEEERVTVAEAEVVAVMVAEERVAVEVAMVAVKAVEGVAEVHYMGALEDSPGEGATVVEAKVAGAGTALVARARETAVAAMGMVGKAGVVTAVAVTATEEAATEAVEVVGTAVEGAEAAAWAAAG